VTGLWMEMVALVTTPPDGSVTVPATFAEFPVCALLPVTAANATNSKNKDPRNALTNLIGESPLMNGGLCAAQRWPRMKWKNRYEIRRLPLGTRHALKDYDFCN
jgi:hypothetical protein